MSTFGLLCPAPLSLTSPLLAPLLFDAPSLSVPLSPLTETCAGTDDANDADNADDVRPRSTGGTYPQRDAPRAFSRHRLCHAWKQLFFTIVSYSGSLLRPLFLVGKSIGFSLPPWRC